MNLYVASDLMALRTHHLHHIYYSENEGLAGRAHDENDPYRSIKYYPVAFRRHKRRGPHWDSQITCV